jgi:hypothetical protein
MTRRAHQLAKTTMEATSRRGFLGRIARLAGGTAVALGGLAAGAAKAAPPSRRNQGDDKWTCIYMCPDGSTAAKRSPGGCKETWAGCELIYGWPPVIF